MNANTAHIKACRNAYDAHKAICPICAKAMDFINPLCPIGNTALDELCQSIASHKDVEPIEGKPCTE